MATEMAPPKLLEGIVVVDPFGEAPFKPPKGHFESGALPGALAVVIEGTALQGTVALSEGI